MQQIKDKKAQRKAEEKKKKIQGTLNFKKQYLNFYDDIKVSPSEDW